MFWFSNYLSGCLNHLFRCLNHLFRCLNHLFRCPNQLFRCLNLPSSYFETLFQSIQNVCLDAYTGWLYRQPFCCLDGISSFGPHTYLHFCLDAWTMCTCLKSLSGYLDGLLRYPIKSIFLPLPFPNHFRNKLGATKKEKS